MRSRVRACHYVVTTALVAGLGVVLAPIASAVPNSVVLSSFDSGPVGVAGTVTFTPPGGTSYLVLTVGIPLSEYTTSGLSGGCASGGITAAINGTPIQVSCSTYPPGGGFSRIEIYNYWSSGPVSTSDVITMTWADSFVTRTGAASGSAFEVAASIGTPVYVSVTPTLAGSPSSSSESSSAPDMTTWHQSISRAASEAACPTGYTPSWAQWPNGHQGGWVCNREVFAFQPESGM